MEDKRDDFFDNYFFEHDVYEYVELIDSDRFIFSCRKDFIHADIKIDGKTKHLVNGDMKLLFSAYHNLNISDEELSKDGIIRVNGWSDIEHILLDEE